MGGPPQQSEQVPCAHWHPHLWHPFAQEALHDPPRMVRAGRGPWLELADGRRVLDGISSWWVTLHGHGEPAIAAAIAAQAQQLEQVIFANFSHDPAVTLAQRLCRTWSGLDRLFFSDNGSTAVEVCLKMALQYWHNRGKPRQQLIAFDGAYHGDTFGAMALGARSLFTTPFDPLLFAVARCRRPATWWDDDTVDDREHSALQHLDQLLETPTAAVIIEPLVQGAGGMAMVRPGFLQQVAQRVQAAGALLIADEVMTGFGRTGALFASHGAGIQPDLVALSKGLTGGFLPMAVSLAREDIYQSFVADDPRCTFFHGHSFTANPLGCAAANASLTLLSAHPERYQGFAERHRPHLEMLARLSSLEHPRLCGTIAAIDLRVAQPSYLHQAGRQIQRACMEEGVFVRPLGHVLYLLPPLSMNDEQLEQCYEALRRAVQGLVD
ncbi:MAG: adenosylmethionine-8-amino-7-oxononanoate aminotransferase [Candidatus Synechococcus spongiarum SP3]|uniref:Adenosylmethionine-8-amino-7-oxononanoate aminotransferase n=1 Tax=Candidatus Synechococcus spongiarum SP3 TaxID=1604020 RepID=A0A0G2IWY5_9SYNE|nr:MAG: adenosylmethionine-8-amino-7-oxononanoate aminotransferase [Candidatus Synechococcus spongiarum SP3]